MLSCYILLHIIVYYTLHILTTTYSVNQGPKQDRCFLDRCVCSNMKVSVGKFCFGELAILQYLFSPSFLISVDAVPERRALLKVCLLSLMSCDSIWFIHYDTPSWDEQDEWKTSPYANTCAVMHPLWCAKCGQRKEYKYIYIYMYMATFQWMSMVKHAFWVRMMWLKPWPAVWIYM